MDRVHKLLPDPSSRYPCKIAIMLFSTGINASFHDNLQIVQLTPHLSCKRWKLFVVSNVRNPGIDSLEELLVGVCRSNLGQLKKLGWNTIGEYFIKITK